jgi:hypothetical protein
MVITGCRRRRPHRRPRLGYVHLPGLLILLRQRQTARRRRTGLGTTIKNLRVCS